MIEWKGVFPALITPFTPSDQLDLPTFEKNIDAQMRVGAQGLIIGGSLGEASTLTTGEKEILVESALGKVGNKIPVVLNIAESSTADALQQVKLAMQWNVH